MISNSPNLYQTKSEKKHYAEAVLTAAERDFCMADFNLNTLRKA